MTEALQKLSAGAKFDDVAREFSEDKARAGGCSGSLVPVITPLEIDYLREVCGKRD